MKSYKTPYITLFNQMTDTITALEFELNKLKQAQIIVEEMIISENDIELESENSTN